MILLTDKTPKDAVYIRTDDSAAILARVERARALREKIRAHQIEHVPHYTRRDRDLFLRRARLTSWVKRVLRIAENCTLAINA